MINKNIEIRFNGETVRMESALIAGKETRENNTSMYIGPLNLDEIHNALFLVNTGVLKILTRELGVELDDCDDFLLSAMSEALTYEWNAQRGKVPDVDASKVIRYRNE